MLKIINKKKAVLVFIFTLLFEYFFFYPRGIWGCVILTCWIYTIFSILFFYKELYLVAKYCFFELPICISYGIEFFWQIYNVLMILYSNYTYVRPGKQIIIIVLLIWIIFYLL